MQPSNEAIEVMFEQAIEKYTALSEGANPEEYESCSFCDYYVEAQDAPGCNACPLGECNVCYGPYQEWCESHGVWPATVILEIIQGEFLSWKESGIEDKKCLVHGCINKRSQGTFIGELCKPCYDYLRTGKVGPTTSFLKGLQESKS